MAIDEKLFPYQVTISADYVGALLWCEKHCGKHNVNWCNTIHFSLTTKNMATCQSTWYFKNEKHATLFALIWQ